VTQQGRDDVQQISQYDAWVILLAMMCVRGMRLSWGLVWGDSQQESWNINSEL
jgi:hypothetical protein